MKRIIERWHWGRLYVEDYSLLFANVMTQKRLGHHRSQPLMLAREDEIVLSTGEVTLSEGPMVFHPARDREHPTWLRLEVPGRVDLRLTVDRVIDAQDLLDEVPVARSRFVKPLVHRLVGPAGLLPLRLALRAHRAPGRPRGTPHRPDAARDGRPRLTAELAHPDTHRPGRVGAS